MAWFAGKICIDILWLYVECVHLMPFGPPATQNWPPHFFTLCCYVETLTSSDAMFLTLFVCLGTCVTRGMMHHDCGKKFRKTTDIKTNYLHTYRTIGSANVVSFHPKAALALFRNKTFCLISTLSKYPLYVKCYGQCFVVKTFLYFILFT